MRRALDELRLSGPTVTTTAGFLRDVLDHPRFCRAEHDTSLINEITTVPRP